MPQYYSFFPAYLLPVPKCHYIYILYWHVERKEKHFLKYLSCFLYLCLNLLGGGRLSAVYLELVQLSGSLLVLHREFFLPHSKSTYLENISFLLCSQLRRCIHFLLLFQIQSNFLENIQPCFTSTVFSILWSILARIFFGLLTNRQSKLFSLFQPKLLV